MKIVNQSRVNLEYQYDPTTPIVKETQVSNLAITYIVDDRLCVHMSTDKEFLTFFETMEYQIRIWNICGITITNIRIRDLLPKTLYYIQNSIIVNGIRRRCCNLCQGVLIESIEAGGEVMILFRVVVPVQVCPIRITNRCMVSYDYQYDYQLPIIQKVIESNWVTSRISNVYYKMVSVSANIIVRNRFSELQLNEIELIPVQRKSIQGKYGSSIVIIDIMECTFSVRKNNNRRKYIMKARQGTACTMNVAEGVRFCDIGNIQGRVEDVQLNQVSCMVWNLSLQVYYNFMGK